MRAFNAKACLFVVCVALAPGCFSFLRDGHLPTVPLDELPATARELVAVADRIHRTSRRQRDLIRARTALLKAEVLNDHSQPSISWRLARVDSILARIDTPRAGQWADEGLKAADKARKALPDRVHGHLYYAICAGLSAKANPTRAESLLKAVVESALRATEIDPHYEGGEARRVLGAIYLYAPPWPTGVGDIDEAVSVLETLTEEHPEDPRSWFYLAEAYRRTDDRRRAAELYRRVLSAKRKGLWAIEGPPYRRDARARLEELGAGRG